MFGVLVSLQIAEEFLVRVLNHGKENSICKSFNHLRYLESRNKVFMFSELPCNSDGIRFQILRAFYHVFVQKRILDPPEFKLDPCSYANTKIDDAYQFEKTQRIYPPVEELVPNCTDKTCKTTTCMCKMKGLKCISYCLCQSKETCCNTLNDK